MKRVRINAVVSRIFALLLMFQVNAFVSFAQDTRAQQSKKSRLEKEIAAIDKQLKDNAMQSKNAMTALTLTRQKIEARKALVEDSDREIAVLRGRSARNRRRWIGCRGDSTRCRYIMGNWSRARTGTGIRRSGICTFSLAKIWGRRSGEPDI